MSTRRSNPIVAMGFPDRGEENLMRQTSRCKNFQPNMFNKTKCQNCFRTREAHDLGDDDGSNKPKKALQYGFLFVAPGIDFDNPMSRNRKWQRRCFVLYENGELAYYLDSNVDQNTQPQESVNMYQCTKVFNADQLTGHPFSIGITVPDKTTYIRAEVREEKDRWYETLIEYPEINREAEKQKKKKRGVFPMVGPKSSEKSQKIEEQAEAKPEVPSSGDDPLSEIDHEETRDELGPVGNTSELLGNTARDTTDISTASSRAARREKSNLRRSHSALEHRPERYEKKAVRRTPSAQPSTTTRDSAGKRMERLNRRHTALGRTEVKNLMMSEDDDEEDEGSGGVTGKGDATRRQPMSIMKSRQSESGLAELERELKQSEASLIKSHRESLPATSDTAESTLHRNNNNVYKDISPRMSPTHHTASSSSRKSSLSETDSSHSTATDSSSQAKKPLPSSKADATNSQNLLSQEELQRMDVPKRGRFRMNKALIEGETQSPSKRTIERRRHAQERRNRHTLDGSTVPFPISERKTDAQGPPRLKRSNSDPNLADNEEVKRKEIAETFPGLLHLKNGWLMMMDTGDWVKYWFVLRDNKLSYFKDSSDDSLSNLAGAMDLARCKEATETSASRNYGFQVKMEDDSVERLGAMTSGIRTNWIQAINKAIATAQQEANPDKAIATTPLPDSVTVLDTPTSTPAPAPAPAPTPVQPEATAVTQQAPEVEETPSPAVESTVPDVQQQPTPTAPDVIPTNLPKQDGLQDISRANLSIDLTSRHRKSSWDSRLSETASPTTDRDSAFPERQGSLRSKERRSRRSSRGGDDSKRSRSSLNGRSSSTSSEVFETPPNTPTPVELRIEEPPVRRSSSTSSLTRSERFSSSTSNDRTGLGDETLQIQKIEADSLKTQPDQQPVDSIQLENITPRKSIDLYQRQPSLDNENEQRALVSQLETVVKKLSQVELQNQTLHMEVKQARNASELLKHEKEELQDKVDTSAGALEKRNKECESFQARFEKLVTAYQESEKEVSKARTSLKAERDKAVTMIERLNQQIDVLEGDKKDLREKAKKSETELSGHKDHMRQLAKNQEESQEIIKKLLSKMEGYKQRLEAKGDDGSATKELVQKLDKQQQDLQEQNMLLQARLQEMEKERAAKTGEPSAVPGTPETESEMESELVDLRMELSEKDEQIEQLSEQLELEFAERSSLQKKYDTIIAESAQYVLEGQGDKAPEDIESRLKQAAVNLDSLNAQLSVEASQRKDAEDKLSKELSVREKLETSLRDMQEQLRIAMEDKGRISQAQDDTKSLMELLQGKNKEVEKLQQEMKRVETDRISLMEQSGKAQADLDAVKQQLKEFEESKTTLEGDLECVLQSKLDLEESAKQTASELVTVRAELETLKNSSPNTNTTEDAKDAKFEAAIQENQLLKAKVEKVQAMYTEDMFKKEQLLADEHEKFTEMERKYASLQSKLTQKDEDVAKKEREAGEKSLEMTQQVEQLEQKVERGDRDLKRVRQDLKSSQDNYDALELKHMQSTEEAKQQQKSQQEQLELMGRRIQDLTSKLGSAERKLAGPATAATTAAKPAGSSDTSDSSDCPSSDGVDGGSKIKTLELRLLEMETKLKQVTHRLVDVTTRELEKRKAYQAKCVAENKLKDQVRGLQREVLALRQQMEKVQSHSESSARQTHSLLANCRQHLMRFQHTKPQESPVGHGATDSLGVSKGSTNTAANTTDKNFTSSSAAASHVTDACHTLDKTLDLLVSQLKTLDMRKRKSLTEFSESVILGLTSDLSLATDGDSPKSPMSCPSSPLFFPTSPPLSPDISPRSSKHSSKRDLKFGPLIKFQGRSSYGFGHQTFNNDKMQRIRYCHCLLEVEYLNSYLDQVAACHGSDDEIDKLLSCHRMIEAEERDGSIVLQSPRGKVTGFAAGLSKSIINEAESEFLAMKEPAEPSHILGSTEIRAVYSACTTFFTNNWEYSHSLEKDLEEKCDALARLLAEETNTKKQDSPADARKSLRQSKDGDRDGSSRMSGKNDSGLGFDADLAPFAEGIAYEEALRVAMECVSSELVLAEALQSVNSTIEDFVGRIDAEEQKCKRVLSLLKLVGVHRYGLIRDAIARQLEATSGLIRQKYWDYLQDSDDEAEDKMEEVSRKRKSKKAKKQSKENLKNGSPKHRVQEERECTTENDIAYLVLLKAVLSGLVVHLRSELSLLAEGNSNQNNDAGGLSLDALGEGILDSQVVDFSDHVTATIKEEGEGKRGTAGDLEEGVRARASTLERITADHSRNIALVRERYDAIIKGERTVHEQELVQLRQRLVTADATVKRLEDDIGKVGSGGVREEEVGATSESGFVRERCDFREARQQLSIMRADILELKEYHEMKLAHIAEGIEAITRCYRTEIGALHASYRRKLAAAEDKGQEDLAEARRHYHTDIAEMERQHEAQTKRLVQEAKMEQGDEALQAQHRRHTETLEEIQRRHRKELETREEERLKEKEQEEEAVTTTISALKRSFEAELEKERQWSQDAYPKDVETIMKRHREVVGQMNKDWLILSSKFSEQCRENSLLSKALRAMQRSQKEAHERLQRVQVETKKEVSSLGMELAQLEERRRHDQEEEEEEEEDEKTSEELKVLQMNLRLREIELEFAREEIESLRQTKASSSTSSSSSAGVARGAVGGDTMGSHREEREKAGAGEISRQSSSFHATSPETENPSRPRSKRSLSDLTQRFYKSKKGDKK